MGPGIGTYGGMSLPVIKTKVLMVSYLLYETGGSGITNGMSMRTGVSNE